MITLLLADDHQMVLEGLQQLLQHEKKVHVVHTCYNGREVLQALEKQPVDVVVLDINMPVMDGTTTVTQIKERFPDVRILMLTMHNEAPFIQRLIELGIHGYILKNSNKRELVLAVETIHAGHTYLSQEATNMLAQGLAKPEKPQPSPARELISSRELEIIALIAKEKTVAEIADLLFISENTVKSHRKNIYSKLEVRNSAGLVTYAFQHGLLDAPAADL